MVRLKRLGFKRLVNLTTTSMGWWCDANGWEPSVRIAPLASGIIRARLRQGRGRRPILGPKAAAKAKAARAPPSRNGSRKGKLMRRIIGFLLILIGAVANNVVYLQDEWLGQSCISLDSARAYGGIVVSLALILAGALLMWRRPGAFA